jgi:signal transduction histidine kinase
VSRCRARRMLGIVQMSDEASARHELADAIDRRRADIESEWLRRVQAGLRGTAVNPTDLRNAMPDYLRRLAEALRDEAIEPRGVGAWQDVAREHAVTRVRLGFDIDQLVREFVLLRQVLGDVVREERVGDLAQSLALLADLVESAISVSVKTYVESRDGDAQRSEAERIGFITHELRTPLGTVSLVFSHLRSNMSLEPAQVRAAGVIERNLKRLQELIDGLLGFERFEARVVECRRTTMALRDVLERVLEGARPVAAAKGLTLEATFDPEVVVSVDPELAWSALQNVIGNAVKFTDEGHVDVTAEETRDEVVIHVRDDGPGLSPGELREIFEPFHRGSSRQAGMGLGLAIARRAIETEGGRIHVESNDGHGCHFWMTLPKRAAVQAQRS